MQETLLRGALKLGAANATNVGKEHCVVPVVVGQWWTGHGVIVSHCHLFEEEIAVILTSCKRMY